MTETTYPKVGEYVVCFIDILGQRAVLRAYPRAPKTEDPAVIEDFVAKAMATVGKVAALHKYVQFLMNGLDSYKSAPIENSDPRIRQFLEASRQHNINQQRWSDGVMLFSSISEASKASKIRNIVCLVSSAGIHVLLGFAEGYAIRGGIEIGWASEMKPGELYGAAVAAAYELESEIAQYPRIVVGEQLVQYINEVASVINPDIEAAGNQAAARMALDLIKCDVDGVHIVDYLGQGFRNSAGNSVYHSAVSKALEFVRSQLLLFQKERNTKLAFRYQLLLSYFLANRDQQV